MPATIDIVPLDEALKRNHQTDAPNLFACRKWLSALDQGFPLHFFVLTTEDNAFSIPFARRDDLLGKHIIALPFTDYLDPQLDEETLMDALAQLTASHEGYAVTLRLAHPPQRLLNHPDWRLERSGLYHLVAVSDEAQMLGNCKGRFRNQLRQGQRQGLTVQCNKDEASLRRFYDVYCNHRRERFGILTHPYEYYQAIHNEFFLADQGYIFEISDDNQTLASTLVLAHQDVLYYKCSASVRDSLHLRPNNLILWDILRFANRQGFRHVNLGLSWLGDDNQGLVNFKESLGGIAAPVGIFRFVSSTYDPTLENQTRPLLRNLTDVIVKSPLTHDQYDQLGRLLFHYFT